MKPLVPSRAAERPPQLVLRFALCTALGLAVAAIAIALLFRTSSTAQSQRTAIERARFATEAVLAHSLRPGDLASPASTARRRALDRLFRDRVLLEDIRGVALYDAGGGLVYATSPQAPRAVSRAEVQEALRGVASSAVKASSHVEGDALRTTLPLVLGSPPTSGVAVFEQDYGPIAVAGRRAAFLAAAILEGLLVLLFLLLAPLLLRVTSRIRGHVAELEHASSHDDATGAANRYGLRRALDAALVAKREGALLLVDLDGFSELHEIFGSAGSDAVLVELAHRLRWELADSEVVARVGEDEFAVLIDGASPEGIEQVARTIHACIASPVVIDAVRVAVSVSIGAAVLEPTDDLASVLRRAGVALAVAKNDADDVPVRLHEARYEASAPSRAALLTELREGIANGEVLAHFQPQVDLATHQVRGVEALLRWQHPSRGLLTAGAFVEEAERSGLALEIRRLVLESAARSWLDWTNLGLQLEISINLGPVDLLDASLPEEVGEVLEAYGIPPWNLVREITERTLIGDERRTREVMDALRSLGVRLAIDDFGVGFSSLASLQRFSVQVVKLDRSLIANARGEPAARAIVRGSIDLAHSIGATVIAEGVETEEQLELVRELGCDIAQGYLVGRPAPPHEIAMRLLAAPAVTEAQVA
jgi:diguanylate cyclase (GGDEF)-like protein